MRKFMYCDMFVTSISVDDLLIFVSFAILAMQQSNWISSLFAGSLFRHEVGKESGDRQTRIRSRRSGGVHLKTRGGESLSCRHSSCDGFRDVVYDNIIKVTKVFMVFFSDQSICSYLLERKERGR